MLINLAMENVDQDNSLPPEVSQRVDKAVSLFYWPIPFKNFEKEKQRKLEYETKWKLAFEKERELIKKLKAEARQKRREENKGKNQISSYTFVRLKLNS